MVIEIDAIRTENIGDSDGNPIIITGSKCTIKSNKTNST
jgi:hypothetical protein